MDFEDYLLIWEKSKIDSMFKKAYKELKEDE